MSNEDMVILIQQGHDLMGELYMQNKKFIYRCVKSFQSSTNEIDDLMQIGYLGLEKAVKVYKAELGYKFLTYAKCHIVNTARREVNSQQGIPDRIYTLLQQYKHSFDKLTTLNGKSPSEAQISLYMGISIKELEAIKKYMVRVKSLDESFGDDNNTTICDTIVDDNLPDMDDIAEQEDLKRILWGEVDKLPDNQKDVLVKRYQENKTFGEISEIYGVTRQTIRQTETNAMRKLRIPGSIRQLFMDYVPIRHVTLSEYKTTLTSATEWAAMWREQHPRAEIK